MELNGIRVDASVVDGMHLLSVEGTIDSVSAHELGAVFDTLEPDDCVLLDLASVDLVDSTGLVVILAQSLLMSGARGCLRVRDASGALRKVLEVTRLADLIHFDDG